jgi:DNA polymerase III epsilon subunit-like protein
MTDETTTRTSQPSEDSAAVRPRRLAPYAAIDCETTGLSCKLQEAVSVAVVLADADMVEVESHHWLILPERLHAANPQSLIICGYDEARWEREARSAALVGRDLHAVLTGKTLIAHNLDFDKGFIAGVLRAASVTPPWGLRSHCTLKAARVAKAKGALKTPGCRLDELCAALRLPFNREEGEPHSALDDARAALHLARALRERRLL